MVSRFDLRIDVSDAVGLDAKLETAAWLYIPDAPPRDGSRPVVMFAFPGGTYSRAYYDLQVPGRAGYSMAEHVAGAGHIVVACDHVGLGDSTAYEPVEALTPEVVVRANVATVSGVLDQLVAGEFGDGLASAPPPYVIGVGHSIGGYLLVQQQAWHRSFDAMALLGVSLSPPPAPDGPAPPLPPWLNSPDPTRPPREDMHPGFHDERVPADVIAADDALAVPFYPWMVEAIKDGGLRTVKAECAGLALRIETPVFLGFGSRDQSPEPHSEIGAYSAATDVTLFVLPNAAHCFNFAETRQLFYERLTGWAGGVAQVYGGARLH